MRMSVEERFLQVQKKNEQHKQKKMLDENREREVKKRSNIRRLIIIGELFCKHFPIAQEIVPGRSVEEDRLNFEHLDHFIEALAKCQECYQEMEGALVKKVM